MNLTVKQVFSDIKHIYLNLAQAYEAEFSKIVGKAPDENGIFPLDTQLNESTFGFVCYVENVPAGIAAISQNSEYEFEVCEFYIVPYFRKQRLGMQFSHKLFDLFKGQWQIKQIAGADYATQFWQETLRCYQVEQFSEDYFTDPYWGKVTRQKFSNL